MGTHGLMTLYKPVGKRELALIERSGWSRFPPRLKNQPVFYTAICEDEAMQYAQQSAGDDTGYVMRFHVRKDYINKYRTDHANDNSHDELSVPLHALEEFNNNIIGLIELAMVVR